MQSCTTRASCPWSSSSPAGLLPRTSAGPCNNPTALSNPRQASARLKPLACAAFPLQPYVPTHSLTHSLTLTLSHARTHYALTLAPRTHSLPQHARTHSRTTHALIHRSTQLLRASASVHESRWELYFAFTEGTAPAPESPRTSTPLVEEETVALRTAEENLGPEDPQVHVRGEEEVRFEFARWQTLRKSVYGAVQQPSTKLERLCADAEVAAAHLRDVLRQAAEANDNARATSNELAQQAAELRAKAEEAWRRCEEQVNLPGQGWHHRRKRVAATAAVAEERAAEAEVRAATEAAEEAAVAKAEQAKVEGASRKAEAAAEMVAQEKAVRAARSQALASIAATCGKTKDKNPWAGVLHRRRVSSM